MSNPRSSRQFDPMGRALREAGCKNDLAGSAPPPACNLFSALPVDAVAKEALGIDRVETELLAQLLAQLADVAFHDVFLDVFVEDAVDRVEDLRLGEPAAAVCDQVFQDAALTARQREDFVVDLGIATVREDADR